jgi:hypothetical protein
VQNQVDKSKPRINPIAPRRSVVSEALIMPSAGARANIFNQNRQRKDAPGRKIVVLP